MNLCYSYLPNGFRTLFGPFLFLTTFCCYGQQTRTDEVIWSVGRWTFPAFVNGVTVGQIERMDEVLQKARQGEKIVALAVNTVALRPEELPQLRQLVDIKTLLINVESEASLDSLINILADLPQLEVLGLTTYRGVFPGQAEKALIKLPARFKNLSRLREIRLSDADFDLDAAIVPLAEMPNLRLLELNGFLSQHVTIPASISRLTQVTHLRLNRQVNYLPSVLGELRNLKQLTISNQMPTDSGLAQVLPRLTRLEKLDITFVNKAAAQGQQMMNDVMARVQKRPVSEINQTVTARFPVLSGLTRLRSLKLAGSLNRMVFPDGVFDGLTQLDTLELTGFQISQPLNVICALQGLRFLNLKHNQLNELPACIGQLNRLEVLQVEYDSLKTLPASLANLNHLTHLHLTANQLQTLPETIGQLTALQELKLNDNELRALPASLGQLRQLELLEVKTNQLTALPELGQLTNLRTLNVFDNQIALLPASLSRLTNLRTLVFLGNRLTQLPADIGNLRLLHTLIIDQNNLTSLPESIGKLDSLQRLFIGENQLRQLPENLLKLRNLRELYIGKNQLTSLPVNMGALQALESFNLVDNPIIELPESVGAWTKLKTASINYTNIRLLPTTIGKWVSVTSINADNNELLALPSEIGQCRQLTRLSVRNANLLGLPESIGRLQQLKELVITGKTDEQRGHIGMGEVQKLPDSLAYCGQLYSIRINHQREFDAWSFFQLLPKFKNLRELDLGDCGIIDLPALAWSQLPLQRLVLSKNKLTQVPINLASGPSINWIDLSDNPLPATLNQPFSSMDQLRGQLVEQATAAVIVPRRMPDAQLMQTCLNFARQKMEQRYWTEALADIDRAQQFAPDSLLALLEGQRADLHLLRKEYALAITHYENALAKATLLPAELIESTFPILMKFKSANQQALWWGNKGIAQGELGQYEQALSNLQKGLGLLDGQDRPSVAGALLLAQGRFLALTQKGKEAQVCFVKAADAFRQNDLRTAFTPRRFVRRMTMNSSGSFVFIDPESIKRQLTLAGLGLLTDKTEVTQRELSRITSTYPMADIGIYGLVADYLTVCQAIINGKQTPVQAKESLQKVLSNRSATAGDWSFDWLEAAWPIMPLSTEKKDTLRQLTSMVKERVREEK